MSHPSAPWPDWPGAEGRARHQNLSKLMQTTPRTQKAVKAEIREAKRAMEAAAFGTPEHLTAKARFWDLQKELGALELEALGIAQ